MNISKKSRKLFIEEIKFVREKMKTESDFKKKGYYYSAIFGFTGRLINLDYDPSLVFINVVLQASHAQIQSVMTKMASGDLIIIIDDKYWQRLDKMLEQLEKTIESEEDNIHPILEKITCLLYELTGNGHYLKMKGTITI